MTLTIHRFATPAGRLWALGQMAAARPAFAAMRDCTFWKLCGSGSGVSFTPRRNPAVWPILACRVDAATARHRTATAPVFQRWRERADESWTAFLTPLSTRGRWSGRTLFESSADGDAGPLAALTRATIRPRRFRRYWQRVPNISAMIGGDTEMIFKIGIGELPWLHQVTFSGWPDAAAMARFARADGPHARAIRAVREGDWFAEKLYARFRVTGSAGRWNGIDPLTRHREAA